MGGLSAYPRVQQQYAQQLQQFAPTRRRWDPDGMFCNDFLERLFAPYTPAA